MPLRSEGRFIGIANVKPGMMIDFSYTKSSGGSGRYTVLVVDPNRKNSHAKEAQLHGFVIDELGDRELIEFFTSFRKTVNISGVEDRRASIVEDLNSDEAYNTFKTSKYVDNRSYRTFNLSGMSSVRQILMGEPE